MKVFTVLISTLVVGLHALTVDAIDCNRSFKCLTNYEPVCGSDGKTYANECVLSNAVCQQKKTGIPKAPVLTQLFKGPCDMPNNPFCAIRCSRELKPVCGSDGKTYNNECMLTVAKCGSVALYSVHRGECKPKPKECKTGCTKIYLPVCGSDGVTYSNECELSVAACKKNTKITKKSDGECKKKDCKDVCAMIYAPVCGSDGVTYSNACLMGVAACKKGKTITKKSDGECKTQPPKKCDDVCPFVFMPVCGSDGITYQNLCLLNVAACQKNKKITKKYDGECKTEPPKKCDDVCNLMYVPVCGSDGVTYGNACQMEATACKTNKRITKKSDGECKAQPPTKCNDECKEILKPVCGSDGVTYSNACELGVAACKAKKTTKITKKHDGKCRVSPGAACAAMSCMQYTECKVDSTTGQGYCADVCMPGRCGAYEKCTLEKVQCVTTPCPPIAKCSKQ